MPKPFKLEADLRAAMREAYDDEVRWLEPKGGATFGLPDCWLPLIDKKELLWVELKLGEINGDWLTIKFTPAQKREFPKLMRDYQKLIILVGEKGGERLWLLEFWPELLSEKAFAGPRNAAYLPYATEIPDVTCIMGHERNITWDRLGEGRL